MRIRFTHDRLPIYEIEDEIVRKLAAVRPLVLQAPTGSGKSTQMPQILLKHGLLANGQVVILQPRRLAARLLASRVAKELGVEIGHEVGYQIRFENVTSGATRIKFETEGVLLRQLIDDPAFTGVQAIIFDEFHERHLYGDVTLARALDIQEQKRPDLILIVMSATLDSRALEKYLAPCAVLRSEGRMFPVDVDYLPRRLGSTAPPVWDLAADAFSQGMRGSDGGRPDVLIFMPGSYEIHRTIEAIRLVIDSGLARIPRYDPHRGINTLFIERISQSSAEQRAGRAGRTAPGRCLRLWSKPEHSERPLQETPEIERLDLSEVVLTLKAAGIEELRSFRWLEAPPEKALNHAEELLIGLGRLKRSAGDCGRTTITGLGRRMLAFPVHPRYARMLLAAEGYDCVYHACLIAALTQGRDLLLRNPGQDVLESRREFFGAKDTSDFWILMRAWRFAVENEFRIDVLRKLGIHGVTARQVGPLHEQFLRIARDGEIRGQTPDFGSTRNSVSVPEFPIDDEALRKCIVIGFSDRIARMDEATLRCELVDGRRGTLARESAARGSSLIVAAEIHEIGGRPGEVNTILSLATAIEADWLRELFPDEMRSEVRTTFDAATRRVQAVEVVLFRDLVLESKRIEPPPADAAARLLAGEILAGRLQLPAWDHAIEQWILRLNLVSEWCPELQLPPIRDDDRRHIIEQLCLGAFSFKDVKERDVKPAVKSWLSSSQQGLVDKYAPERITLSNSRTPKVIYEANGLPYISMRIQELFRLGELPRIAMSRVPLSIHILAPSMRPVQVTQDLANFWREHYPRVKSELP